MSICSKSAASTLAVLSLLVVGSAAQAQVRNYDTVYPMGAPFTINERGAIIPGEQPELLNEEDFQANSRRHHERVRREQNVYGKTIQITPGMGGAHFVD